MNGTWQTLKKNGIVDKVQYIQKKPASHHHVYVMVCLCQTTTDDGWMDGWMDGVVRACLVFVQRQTQQQHILHGKRRRSKV